MSNNQQDESPQASVRNAWHAFIDRTSKLRPELFRFALRLTNNPFDAEDLVHDVLLKAFAAQSVDFGRIQNERAYLYRMLSNQWIDVTRHRQFTSTSDNLDVEAEDHTWTSGEVQNAAYQMFSILPPKERVCLILQDVCDFSQSEIADFLATTKGSVKVAVHRARARLPQNQEQNQEQNQDKPTTHRTSRVSRVLVEKFVAAMLSHDLEALKAIMLDSLEAEVFPCGKGVGLDEHISDGWIKGCFYHHIEWRENQEVGFPLRLEIFEVDDEPVVLVIRQDEGDNSFNVEEVWRLEEADGCIARARDYGFCPDLVQHIANESGWTFRRLP